MEITEGCAGPFFRIVVPVHNRATRVGASLASIRDQSFGDFEVIVVDDGSTDDSLSICRAFESDRRFRVIALDSNMERSHARNVGLDQATGRFATFLDSDDLLLPGHLARARSFLGEHVDARVAFAGSELFDTATGAVKRRSAPKLPDLDAQARAIASHNFLTMSSVFLHRDVYISARFDTDPRVIGCEDWDLWLRLLAQHRVASIDSVGTRIVFHAERSALFEDLSAVRTRHRYLLDKVRADPALRQTYKRHLLRMRAGRLIVFAGAARRRGRPLLAMRSLLLAAVLDPRVMLSRSWLGGCLATVTGRR